MYHQELHEKHGLKEYHVSVRFFCNAPWRVRAKNGRLLPAALAFDTIQANKEAAEVAGFNYVVSQGFRLKDILSIEVEEKTE